MSPVLQATAKHSHLEKGSHCDTDSLAFRSLSIVVFCCLRLGAGSTSHGSSALLPFFQWPCGATSREHPSSCLCPRGRVALSQGGEHLLSVKHLLFLYTFVTAVTVCFLFHRCLLPVNHHLNPPLSHSCWKGQEEGSGLFGL